MLTPRSVGATLFALLLPALSAGTAELPTNITYRVGIGGLACPNAWFPFTVEPREVVRRLEVELLPTRPWYSGRAYDLRYRAAPGENTLLCRNAGDRGEPLLRCHVETTDGRQFDQVVRVGFAQSLIGILSGDAARFDFLSTIGDNGGSSATLVPIVPEDLPDNWLALSSLATVILDEPFTNQFTRAQAEALDHWLRAGGRVLLTSRAFAGREDSGWPFAAWVAASPSRESPSPCLAALMPKYADALRTVPNADLRTPPDARILWHDETTFLAARPYGQGRVTVLGIDWTAIPIADLRVLEGLRKELWATILSAVAAGGSGWPDARGLLGVSALIPREARASYLKWYLLVFLVVYVVAFALVNWLVLARRRRFEFSAVTLPAGALVLAVAAYGIGVALRGREPHITENVRIRVDNSRAGLLSATACLIKADRRPVDVSAVGRQVLSACNTESGASLRYRGCFPSGEGFGQDMTVGVAGDRTTYHAVRVPTWTLAGMALAQPIDAGGGLSAEAFITGSQLVGRVASALPFDVEDACIVYASAAVPLGRIASGAAADFALALPSSADLAMRRCPHCGRFHGYDPAAAALESLPALTPEWRDAYGEARGQAGATVGNVDDFPVFLARTAGRPPIASIDRPGVVYTNRVVCVAPVALALGGGAIDLPYGVLAAAQLSPEWEGDDWPRHDAPQVMPGILARTGLAPDPAANAGGGRPAVDPFAARRPRGHGSIGDPFGGAPRARGYRMFMLPAGSGAWAAEGIRVRWVVDKPEPDDEADGGRPAAPPERYALAAFHWPSSSWTTQAVVEAGTTNILELAPAAAYYDAESASVLLVTDLEKLPEDEKRHHVPTAALDLAFRARREPGAAGGEEEARP